MNKVLAGRRTIAAGAVPALDDDAIHHAAQFVDEVAGLLDAAAAGDRAGRTAALEQALSCLAAASVALRMAVISTRERR